MGGLTRTNRAVACTAGFALRIKAKALMLEFERGGVLQDLLLHYMQALITQTAQTTVCNRHHSLDQQLCRWLLLRLDRLPSHSLLITQELIANMLGVRRESVTESAVKLQAAGIIHSHRGRITVIDRPGLEALACECYAVVDREYKRLLQQPASA
jgi:CRP-like cAMP-binding protein